MDRDVQPLLGFRACVDMGIVKMSPDVHQVTMKNSINFNTEILTQYQDLFSEELLVTYTMMVDPSIVPVVRPAHRIPVVMQGRVQAELERMQRIGFITPVSEPTDWVFSMVPTHKKDKPEIRLCICWDFAT